MAGRHCTFRLGFCQLAIMAAVSVSESSQHDTLSSIQRRTGSGWIRTLLQRHRAGVRSTGNVDQLPLFGR